MARTVIGGRMSIRLFSVALLCVAMLGAVYAGERPPGQGGAADAKNATATSGAATRPGYGAELKLALIPAGKFIQGAWMKTGGNMVRSRDGGHEVTLTKSYYMGIYPVTQEQYVALMGKERFFALAGDAPNAADSDRAFGLFYKPQYPIRLRWLASVEFCRELSRRTGSKVRLPTAAEWEYACRAGTKTCWFWGNDMSGGADYCPTAADGSGRLVVDECNGPSPVGQKKANPWGLFDMYIDAQLCSDLAPSWHNPEPPPWPLGTRVHVLCGSVRAAGMCGMMPESGGAASLRIVVEAPLRPQPSEFVGVFKFGGMGQGNYLDDPSFISRATAVGDVASLGNVGGPLALVVDKAAPASAAGGEQPKVAPPPKAGETVQLAVPNKLRPLPPLPNVFGGKGTPASSDPGASIWGSGSTRPAAREKPVDEKSPYPDDAIYKVFKDAKPGDLLKIKYTRLASADGGLVISAGPYELKPGEDQPGVYFFVKRTTEKVGNDLRQAIVVQKFEEEFTFIVPNKPNADKAYGPDMAMLTFIDDLKPGDCVKIDLSDKTIKSITKYAPPAKGE
jgi:formylglycine-generating enzyme required for sulfatase activity